MISASRGHEECAALLVSGGADIELADLDGRTPLWFAVQQGQTACALMLLRAGASANVRERRVRFGKI